MEASSHIYSSNRVFFWAEQSARRKERTQYVWNWRAQRERNEKIVTEPVSLTCFAEKSTKWEEISHRLVKTFVVFHCLWRWAVLQLTIASIQKINCKESAVKSNWIHFEDGSNNLIPSEWNPCITTFDETNHFRSRPVAQRCKTGIDITMFNCILIEQGVRKSS